MNDVHVAKRTSKGGTHGALPIGRPRVTCIISPTLNNCPTLNKSKEMVRKESDRNGWKRDLKSRAGAGNRALLY